MLVDKLEYFNGEIIFEAIEKVEENIPIFHSGYFQENSLQERLKVKILINNFETKQSKQFIIIGYLFDSEAYLSLEKRLISNENLIIYFDKNIISVNLNSLDIEWKKDDFLDIIDIAEYENDFLIYDEISVVRIDRKGNEKWRYGGFDHFVSYRGTPNFIFKQNYIEMVDSNEIIYHISYVNGEEFNNVYDMYLDMFSTIEKDSNLLKMIWKGLKSLKKIFN